LKNNNEEVTNVFGRFLAAIGQKMHYFVTKFKKAERRCSAAKSPCNRRLGICPQALIYL